MHVHPDKVTINRQDIHHAADYHKMKHETHDNHPGSEAHLATKPIPDTHQHPVDHRPRQLSGRHH